MSNNDFLDKWKKQLQDFYEEFHQHEKIFRHNDTISWLNDGAKEYAQLGIRSLLTMNGGALIALPAISEAFNLETGSDIECAAYSFAAGLVAIILCILAAYFSMSQGMQNVACERNKDYSRFMYVHMSGVYQKETIDALKKEEEEYLKQGRKHQLWACWLEGIAILFGIISLGGFITGALFFALA